MVVVPGYTSIFEPILDASVVEGWVTETLELWIETYLREIAKQRGELAKIATMQDVYPVPRSYTVSETLEKEAADQLPAIVVISPGLSGKQAPRQEGDGSFRVAWTVGVGVFVSASTREDTKNLVRVYGAAIRAIMLQQSSLGGSDRADGVTWTDESYDDDFQFVDGSTISAGQVIFEVEVAGVVNRQAGPKGPPPDPDAQPGSDWHTADQVFVDITRKETA